MKNLWKGTTRNLYNSVTLLKIEHLTADFLHLTLIPIKIQASNSSQKSYRKLTINPKTNRMDTLNKLIETYAIKKFP